MILIKTIVVESLLFVRPPHGDKKKDHRDGSFDPLFVMEQPAAVLAAVELALLVDGVLYQVKGGSLSAFGADHRVTFSFFFRFVFHFAHCLLF